jgi:tetratricopeptide (TPR) repeat protein
MAYKEMGELDLALADCMEAERLGDPCYASCGALLLNANRPSEAVEYLSKGIEYCEKMNRVNTRFDEAFRRGVFFALYDLRSRAYEQLGKESEAARDKAKAHELQPTSQAQAEQNNQAAEAFFKRGCAYRDTGDWDNAIVYFIKAIQLKPDCAEGFSNLAWACGQKGEYDRSIVDCDEAIRLDPRNALAYYTRGWVYDHMGEKSKSEENYATAKTLGYRE